MQRAQRRRGGWTLSWLRSWRRSLERVILVPHLDRVLPLVSERSHVVQKLRPRHDAVVGRSVRILVEARAAEAVAVHVLPSGDRACTNLLAHRHTLRGSVDHLGEQSHFLRHGNAVLFRLRASISRSEERKGGNGRDEKHAHWATFA